MQKPCALYIDPKGPYPQLLGPERCWDEARDARKHNGDGPVIVHPPCGRWCAMARLNERRWGAKVGDDGGCFAHALDAVVRLGGVLEHPAASLAWQAFGLKKPRGSGWLQIASDAWVCEVWQSAYGHVCNKKTWLLYVGERPPLELDWRRIKGTHQVGGGVNTGNNQKPRASKDQAIHSPVAFAKALIALAEHSRA